MMVPVKTILLLGVCLYAAGTDATVARRTSADYDYIVVGGGTAGLALSTRLSQGLRDAKILVIEAGQAAFDELGINVPSKKGSTLGTKYDWNFTTIPQVNAKNRVFSQNRGKVLGGSSALNLMTYDRSTVNEYDGWEELGNDGWNWDNMLVAMDKSQNFTSANTEWYGTAGVSTTGPIRGTINRYIPDFQAGWVPALNALGIKTNKKYMGGNNLGVSYSTSSIDPTHYNRSYSANGYLPLAGSNLVVLTTQTVVKVNMTKSHGGYRATGVTLANGTFIAARREVILSAGSFGSPGLLELSGIGNKTILASAGITQLIDLPMVGENLQDHIRIQSSYQLKSQYAGADAFRYNATYAAQQLQLWIDGKYSQYDYTGSGYTFQTWKEATGNDAILKALAKAAVGKSTNVIDEKKLEWLNDDTIPQLEVIFSDGYTGVKGYPAVNTTLYGKNFVSLLGVVMHPLARGSVHINATNPLGKPIIDPRYFSNEYDLQAAVTAIKKCRQLALTPQLRGIWDNEYEPGLDKVNTDAEWRDFALNTTLTIYHPTASCAMLPKSKGGVVNPELKVYGTTNLRIVDASIIPIIISAHLQTAVYGIAERAAEMIIDDA